MTENTLLDLVIVGAGPAGLSAAIYAERALLKTVVLEQQAVGGQVLLTSEIDNYPGVPHADGYSLIELMQNQAKELGATIEAEQVSKIERVSDATFELFAGNNTYRSKAVILAGGATPRLAGFEGERDFSGRGVSYCATCDGMFYRDKQVFVVGGGDAALEEALFLTRFAKKVTLLVRKDHLRAQASLAQGALAHDKIEVRYLTSLTKVAGEAFVTELTLRNNKNDEEQVETYPEGVGVFVFVGRVPASDLVAELVDRDENGYVITADDLSCKTPGLYVAGDVRQKPLRQIVTAVADGAVAATSAAAYLD